MPDTRGGSPAMWRIFAFVRALLAGGELPRIRLLKLSEKGFEQRSKHEFGRYTEHEMGQKEPFGSLWGYAANTSETFRTVSGRCILGSSLPASNTPASSKTTH